MSDICETREATGADVEPKTGRTRAAKRPLIKTTKARLLAAVQTVTGMVERRTTLPITQNILLEKRGQVVRFTATDLDNEIRFTAEDMGVGDSDAATTVAAHKLRDILQHLPDGCEVAVTLEGAKVALSAGKARFVLQTLPSGDFPTSKMAQRLGPPIRMTEAALKGMLDQVSFAMAVHDVRYYLLGVRFEARGQQLTAVATDGHRLALTRRSVDHDLGDHGVIIPRKAVLVLANLLKGDGEVAVQFADNQAKFQFGSVEFVTKLVDGQFPDYNRVIPPVNAGAPVVFETAALLAALRRAQIVTKDKGVEITFSAGEATLRARQNDEDGEEHVDAEYSGPTVSVGVNTQYLMTGIEGVGAEKVTITVREAGQSLLVTHSGDREFRYVLMPMRL